MSDLDKTIQEALDSRGLINLLENIRDICQGAKERYEAYENDLNEFLKKQDGLNTLKGCGELQARLDYATKAMQTIADDGFATPVSRSIAEKFLSRQLG